ncbi:MAG: hypothetical protein K6G83_06205 [Lachnospiraceae bacterium]|nr:hypothetical protein [Lachnospiraceae bacterium]
MNDQDKRAVEGMARCGIDLDGLCESFPKFPREELEAIYIATRKSIGSWSAPTPEIKTNCS